jgi:hypothetical protein
MLPDRQQKAAQTAHTLFHMSLTVCLPVLAGCLQVQVGHEQPASATASVPAVPPISVSSSTPKSQPLTPQPTPGAAAAAGHQSSRSTSSFATSPQAASHQTPQLPQQQQQSQQEASSSFQSQPLSTIPVPILHSLVTAVYSGNDNVTRMRRTLAGHLVTQTTGPVGEYVHVASTIPSLCARHLHTSSMLSLPSCTIGVLEATTIAWFNYARCLDAALRAAHHVSPRKHACYSSGFWSSSHSYVACMH